MPELANQYTTLIDVAKRLDPDGRIAMVAEVLSTVNEVVSTANYMQGNLPLGNRVTLRSSLPKPSRRRVNKGVRRGKSTSEQFVDTIELNEIYSDVDVRAILPGSDADQYRQDEDTAFLAGCTQQVARDIIYGNETTEPDAFTGIAPRYGSLSGKYKDQVVDGGGTGGNNTSLYLMTWGRMHSSLVYPVGSKAGLDVRNLGEIRVYDTDGNPYQALSTLYKWDVGLSIAEYRGNARLCNIDVPSLANAGKSGYAGPDLVNLVIDLLAKRKGLLALGKPFFYCNATLGAALRKLAQDKAKNFTIEEAFGKKVTAIDGIPVMQEDAILNTEARVV